MDDQASKQNQKQLESLVEDTRGLSNDLKKRIKSIESKVGSGRDGDIRKQQVGRSAPTSIQDFSNVLALVPQANLVHSKFVEAIQNYQQVEQQYRQKYKQRMERQFKIGELFIYL
jgi:syntaxin 1B/2/3